MRTCSWCEQGLHHYGEAKTCGCICRFDGVVKVSVGEADSERDNGKEVQRGNGGKDQGQGSSG